MHFHALASRTITDGIFIVSLLTAAAYAKWHLWRQTGYGRSRMLLLLSLAAITLEPAIRPLIGPHPGDMTDSILMWVGLTAQLGVLISVAHMLTRLVWINVRRHQHPRDAASHARQHIRHTPWATQEMIDKLLACYNEHSVR
jgi:hypothetical protein